MNAKRVFALLLSLALLLISAAALAEDGCVPVVLCPNTEHGHSFQCWASNGDGTHTSHCVVEGCEHQKTVACPYVQLEVGGQVLSFCPICGDVKGADARILPVEASLTSVNPRGWLGHPQVFVGEMDGYVFVSACYEKSGRTAWVNDLRISAAIPADTLRGLSLQGLGGISDKGLSCDWLDDQVVLGMKLVHREPALLLFSKKQ